MDNTKNQMPLLSNDLENDNTFMNIVLIIIIIIIIWYIFNYTSENFSQSLNRLPKLSNIPKYINSENIINEQNIKMKSNKKNNVYDYNQYLNVPYSDQIPVTPSNFGGILVNKQMDMNSNMNSNMNTNMNTTQNLIYDQNNLNYDIDNQIVNDIDNPIVNDIDNQIVNDIDNNMQDSNLSYTKPYSDQYYKVNINKIPENLQTPDVRSIDAMNKVGIIDAEPANCNLLGVNSANMNNYKKNFYNMYSHQIECPKMCGVKKNGFNKCGLGSGCGIGKDCENVDGPDAIPDVYALNHLALHNNNKKACVTCNYKPLKNKLNREYLENPSYDGLSNDVKIADQQRLDKMKITDANVSNYVNFENNVYLDSIGETQVDKIAEMRSCNNGTCDFGAFGDTIAQTYDKLLSNPAYANRNSCAPYQLSGILEDSMYTDEYANVK